KEEAHHGGAWKVAYADFVTAMMALFMVLWISAQDKQILLATSFYFKQPFNALSKSSIGVMKADTGGSRGKDKSRESASAANLSFLTALARELNRMLNVSDVTKEKPVDMDVTSDGLKVTLYDRRSQPLFEKGTAKPTAWGIFVLQNLAWLADRNNLRVTIDGHTASGFVPTVKDYGPWELSADRANASRRLLEFYAVDPKEIERVSGYGETKPLPNLPPDSESNQRITISLNVNK
ncbi:MAG: OmpA/MotB family protein, partial [Bryobacteraceae bacterium]